MRLSEYKGEEALDILADLLEPASELFGDKEFARVYRTGNALKATQYALKNHKKEVIRMLAIMEGENPDNYQPGLLTIPVRLLELLNDPDLVSLFTSQGQSKDKTSSGPVTVNTEATEK